MEQVFSIFLCFVALSGALAIGQFLWYMGAARGLNQAVISPQRKLAGVKDGELRSTRTRVVWIILDELSHKQIYENRFPGLELPAFDDLARHATVFTHVIPAGIQTEKAVLALILGTAVNEIDISPSGQLIAFRSSPGAPKRTFDPHDTIFQDALALGYSTSIAGWYNPYCRIFADVLNNCFWTDQIGIRFGMRGDGSVLENVKAPWARAVDATLGHLFDRDRRDFDNESHLSDYRKLQAAGDRLLDDPSNTFVFLHVPIPHPAGIYNRKAGTLITRRSSYIDNLALSDRFVAHVRSILEQQNQWDYTTLIVMGDHSWRNGPLFRAPKSWTEEDTLAAAGGFDDRPAYIVKLPHQISAATIDVPFQALETRLLLEDVLCGRIRTPADLTSLASTPVTHSAIDAASILKLRER